ncbi:MAG: hemerythrin family protein [Deltaproteobacteria bacterium]|nr:hemerythrin family protein [Deltaproteobacteria bacterium]
MAFVVFDERFKVGHPEIDRQHSELFDAVNRLHDAMIAGHGRAEVARVLVFLRNYTVHHFQTEERFMRESAYPAYARHKAIHDDLTKKVLELERELGSAGGTLSIATMNFLKDWLAHHIGGEDHLLADHLRPAR